MAKREMKNVTIEETAEVVAAPVEKEEPTPVIGTVTNCSQLNIRKKPTIKGDKIEVVKTNDKLTIDLAGSNDEWYKVVTEAGKKGFCMKRYVTIDK